MPGGNRQNLPSQPIRWRSRSRIHEFEGVLCSLPLREFGKPIAIEGIVRVDTAKTMEGASGTARMPAASSTMTPSFGTSLQQVLGAAGDDVPKTRGSARASLADKQNTNGLGASKPDSKAHKASPGTGAAAAAETGAVLPCLAATPWNFAGCTSLGWGNDPATPQASLLPVPATQTFASETASPDAAPVQAPLSISAENADALAFSGADPLSGAMQELAADLPGKTGVPAQTREGDRSSTLPAVASTSQASMTDVAGAATISASSLTATITAGRHAESGQINDVGKVAAKDSAASGSRLQAGKPNAAKVLAMPQNSPGTAPAKDVPATAFTTATASSSNGQVPLSLGKDQSSNGMDGQPVAGLLQTPSGKSFLESSDALSSSQAGSISPSWTIGTETGQSSADTPGSENLTDSAITRAKPPAGGAETAATFHGHLQPSPTMPSSAATAAFAGSGVEGQTGASAFTNSTAATAAVSHGSGSATQESESAEAMGSILSGVQLMQTLQRSAMQVHINAAEFGRVSVHATYGREGIAAQISLENTDLGSALGSALSAHVPAMEQKLASDGSSRASVSVSTETGSSGGNAGGQGGNTSSERRTLPFLPHAPPTLSSDVAGLFLSTPVPSGSGSGGRLDIRI